MLKFNWVDSIQNRFKLNEAHPLANPGGYWVPEPDLESDESRRKIESIKLDFALAEKRIAKKAAEMANETAEAEAKQNSAKSSQQVVAAWIQN